jgi:GT2 family glycosyltransferase
MSAFTYHNAISDKVYLIIVSLLRWIIAMSLKLKIESPDEKYGTHAVSVLIVMWKNTQHMLQCLEKLHRQSHKNFKVFIIDNGSTDDTFNELNFREYKFQLYLIRLGTNLGFAVANNIGAKLAQGKWIALLNADAFPEPNWLERLVTIAEHNPEYTIFSSKQIQYNKPDLLDGAGDSYHMTGLAWRRYYNKPVQLYGEKQEEVFSACPAAALYSRDEFLKAGGFDEDFFSYFEDVDLGFRLRLSGEKCLYVPEAVVHHVGSASTGKRSDFSVYYGYRNMIWTYVKNMPFPYFWIFLPLHISAVLFFAGYLTLRGQGKVIWKAIFDAIKGLPKMIEKRRTIQKNIKIKPRELLAAMSTGLFEPFQEFLMRNKGI